MLARKDNLVVFLRTICKLGVLNVIQVYIYRINLKIRWSSLRRLTYEINEDGSFFSNTVVKKSNLDLLPMCENPIYFGCFIKDDGFLCPPNWHQDFVTMDVISDSCSPWWKIPDFDNGVKDIKTLWELSRFDWLVKMGRLAAQGDVSKVENMNKWISDWTFHNPPYFGPNWKCAQEASIRLVNIALAAILVDQFRETRPRLKNFLRVHVDRINLTKGYAQAQQNNHSISEAAGLFIGSSWLQTMGMSQYKKIYRRSRKTLERNILSLIASDGSFAMNSTFYHRFILSMVTMVEHWRKLLQLEPFSDAYYQRIKAATQWLYQITDSKTGLAPNLGSNDGSMLFDFSDMDYRDMRPCIQLAAVVFSGAIAYKELGPWDNALTWLNLKRPTRYFDAPESVIFDEGGIAILRHGDLSVILNIPKSKFRPTQCDALHVDFWRRGINLLGDAGTYTYGSLEAVDYFSGTASHNTVQFDGRDQMPRLGRFLLGGWISGKILSYCIKDNSTKRIEAQYMDQQGACHRRKIELASRSLLVTDNVSGFKKSAVIRWRLFSDNWNLKENEMTNGKDRVLFHSNVEIVRSEIKTRWTSEYYLKKYKVDVLEIEINSPGSVWMEYISDFD